MKLEKYSKNIRGGNSDNKRNTSIVKSRYENSKIRKKLEGNREYFTKVKK